MNIWEIVIISPVCIFVESKEEDIQESTISDFKRANWQLYSEELKKRLKGKEIKEYADFKELLSETKKPLFSGTHNACSKSIEGERH